MATEGGLGDTQNGDESVALFFSEELKAKIKEEEGATVLMAVVTCVGEQFYLQASSFKALDRRPSFPTS